MRKVMDDMIAMFPHFFLLDQLRAFVGSSGPSKSTRFGSGASGCASSSAFLLDAELRVCASMSASFSKSETLSEPFSPSSIREGCPAAIVGGVASGAAAIGDVFEVCEGAESYSDVAEDSGSCSCGDFTSPGAG